MAGATAGAVARAMASADEKRGEDARSEILLLRAYRLPGTELLA
jgi:hypothetical protein